ncbi:hypothetical protein C0J52_12245 [Blattella germanica]|nr:hypothetical protein C0J52_12245 [Blattella germanica]
MVPICDQSHYLLSLFVILIITTTTSSNFDKDIKTLTWSGGAIDWPCQSTKSIFKNSGKFIPKNVIATRAQIYKDDAIVALPRFRPGVPLTLAKTSLKEKTCQPTFTAFPCWTLQEEGNCQALQSVVDIFLDNQDILWVLDIGIVHTLENPVKRCPPKVMALNVKTGKVLKIIDLSELVAPSSRLQYIVVDYDKDGDCFIYVSDAATRAILVYDVKHGNGYRVVLPKVVGHGTPQRDVLYLALAKKDTNGPTVLIFTYLSGKRLFSIRTEYLRRGSTSGRVHDLGPKPRKIVIVGTDNGAVVFFRFEGDEDVYSWDTTVPFKAENFNLVHSAPSCALSTHVFPDYKRGRMRVLASNFPDYIQGTIGCGAIQTLAVL